jgi:hypothetical protein
VTNVRMAWQGTSLSPSLPREWSKDLTRAWRIADRIWMAIPALIGTVVFLGCRRRPGLQRSSRSTGSPW